MNPVAKAKRTKKYKAYLSSAAWKAKRQARFRLDGWRCVATVTLENLCYPAGVATITERCPNWDETRSTGKGLVCDHIRYSHFGDEPMEDLRTLCTSCNARETVLHRANWRGR